MKINKCVALKQSFVRPDGIYVFIEVGRGLEHKEQKKIDDHN